MTRWLPILALLALLPACATITKGTTQNITINSAPPGATCDLVRENLPLATIASTPEQLEVSRSRYPILVTCTLAGYVPTQGIIESGYESATLGNLIVGGAVGAAVDMASGANNRYAENFTVALRAMPGGAPAVVSVVPAPTTVSAPAPTAPMDQPRTAEPVAVPVTPAAVIPAAPPAPAAAPGFTPPRLTGRQHTGEVVVAGRHVPLPPGMWQEIKRAEGFTVAARGLQLHNTQVGLVQEDDGRVTAFLEVTVTEFRGGMDRLGALREWDPHPACTARSAYAMVLREALGIEQRCSMLTYAVARPQDGTGEAWTSFLDLGEGRPGYLPATMISAQTRFTTANWSTTVDYRFGVEAAGFPRTPTSHEDSAWHPNALDAARQAHVRRMVAWLERETPAIERSVRRGETASLSAP